MSGTSATSPRDTTSAIADVLVRPLARHSDGRGWLVELYREDELADALHPVMAYVSQTQPGVARGPHEHVDQSDYFAFIGPGDFELLLWDTRPALRPSAPTPARCAANRTLAESRFHQASSMPTAT